MLKEIGVIKILNATNQQHLDDVKNLISEFVKWHLERHLEDIELINEYFDPKDFEKELSSLPGKYSMPEGRLLLALYNNEPAGCVALSKIDTVSC